MKVSFIRGTFSSLVLALLASSALFGRASDYNIEIVAEGLASPTGIATIRSSYLIYTEIPEPGMHGGTNAVKLMSVRSGWTHTISEGEPNPVNVAVGRNGKIYWTCKTAGVILQYDWKDGKSFFLPADPDNDPFLSSPSGITVDPYGDVLFTEVPTPGVYGDEGGMNAVSVSDGETISLISDFEPAPTDIVIGYDGTSYWTCKTAGVIFKRSRAGVASILLTGLDNPAGIALDRRGRNLFFTELPNPGVENGGNKVSRYNLRSEELTLISDFFPQPTDIAVATNGDVYWTCTFAGVIARARSQGRW